MFSQHVHFLDTCVWALGDKYPIKALGMGGRQQRTGPEFGNIYDHHAVAYGFDDGARLISNTRQMSNCKSEMSAGVVGTKSEAAFRERRGGLSVTPYQGEAWTYRGPENNIYQTEHDELFAAIRAGKPINNGRYMAHSTMLAILGRMATYTGQEITWQQAINSKEVLGPDRYE